MMASRDMFPRSGMKHPINKSGYDVTVNRPSGERVDLTFRIYEFEEGRPEEFHVFKHGAKQGEQKSVYESFCYSLSRAVKGRSLSARDIIRKLRGMKGPLNGRTSLPGEPTCSSLPDLLAQVLELNYSQPEVA